jgi:hypothetical protein
MWGNRYSDSRISTRLSSAGKKVADFGTSSNITTSAFTSGEFNPKTFFWTFVASVWSDPLLITYLSSLRSRTGVEEGSFVFAQVPKSATFSPPKSFRVHTMMRLGGVLHITKISQRVSWQSLMVCALLNSE